MQSAALGSVALTMGSQATALAAAASLCDVLAGLAPFWLQNRSATGRVVSTYQRYVRLAAD
jgi:hypothetical protein